MAERIKNPRFEEDMQDNRGRVYCATCEDCKFRNENPHIAMCKKYPYPACKPLKVMMNGPCQIKEKE